MTPLRQLIFSFAMMALMPSVAGADTPVSLPEGALDEVIHSYLLRHPEVLMEMSQRLEQIRSASSFALHEKELVADARDPVAGNPKGDVTLVVFSDYTCPYCKVLGPEIDKLIEQDKRVRVVFKDFPILGQGALMAAKAALASMEQGNYYQTFYTELLKDKTPGHNLAEARVMEIASRIGLDTDKLKERMKSPDIDAAISRNLALGAQMGQQGTPVIYVGNHMHSGGFSVDQLAQDVASVRAATKPAVTAVPPKDQRG